MIQKSTSLHPMKLKMGKRPNTTFTVTLDAGESYQVQAQTGDGDLTGTRMLGNKKFAVFGGNKWTEVPNGCAARDNLLEQMYPLSTWGKKFVTVPNKNNSYSIFRIMAAENNTAITVFGNSTRDYNLDAGEFVEYSEANASYIVSNKGILVAQFTVGQNCNGHNIGDPSMVLLNSIEQTRDTVTLYNSRFQNIQENYINVIVQTIDMDLVYFDGQLLNDLSPFQQVGSNDDYSYAQIKVNTGAHTITSQGCGVIATAYGYGEVESYAYSGGASFSPINSDPIPDGGCLNDTVFFDTGIVVTSI